MSETVALGIKEIIILLADIKEKQFLFTFDYDKKLRKPYKMPEK